MQMQRGVKGSFNYDISLYNDLITPVIVE